MRSFPRQCLLSTALAAAFGTASVTWSSSATAQALGQAAQVYRISVPAQTLSAALNELSRQTGSQVFAAGDVLAGIDSRAVSGQLTLEQALRSMLAGSALEAVKTANGSFAIHRAAPRTLDTTLPVVTVTAASDQETATGPVKGYIAKRSATGTKTDTPIIETPQSISIVTADRIEAIGATRIGDSLAYTPGASISYGNSSRYEWLFLRGFDTYSPGFYLDGLAMRNNGTFGIWRTENYGAERIEVLRGPASVLYGQNSAGGMVNVVSKQPTAEPLHEIRMQLGDHSRKEVAGDFSGKVDEEGKLLYRFTGLVRDANFPSNTGTRDDRIFLAPSLTWRPSSDTTLTVLSQYIRDQSGISESGGPAVGTLLSNPNGRISATTDLGEPDFDRFNQDQWMLGYKLEHRVNNTWTLRQAARYAHLNLDYWQIGARSFATVNAGDPEDPANYRLLNRYVFGSKEKAASFALDNQAQAEFRFGNWQHRLLVGLDYQRTRYDRATYYGGGVAAIDVFSPTYGAAITLPAQPYVDSRVNLVQTGLYVQDQIKFGEHWIATLGGRYDRATIDTDNRLDSTNSRQSDGKFTSRAGLVYLAPNGWAPYVSYSESFVPTTTIDPDTGSPFKPETGRQYEAGIRYQPPGRKDSYSAAVFDLRRRNYVTYDSIYVPKQTGEITVRGLELEALLQPTSKLNLTAAYTWMPKAVVTASSTASEVGKQMYAVSEHQLSLWADYRFGNGLKMGLGARYVGSNYGDYESAPAKVPARTIFDAMVGYDFERWSLALNVRNLTNKTYVAHCAYSSCAYGAQRRVVASATYRW